MQVWPCCQARLEADLKAAQDQLAALAAQKKQGLHDGKSPPEPSPHGTSPTEAVQPRPTNRKAVILFPLDFWTMCYMCYCYMSMYFLINFQIVLSLQCRTLRETCGGQSWHPPDTSCKSSPTSTSMWTKALWKDQMSRVAAQPMEEHSKSTAVDYAAWGSKLGQGPNHQ